jgi:anion-transporting  ArsA/GET3 family ATPase
MNHRLRERLSEDKDLAEESRARARAASAKYRQKSVQMAQIHPSTADQDL